MKLNLFHFLERLIGIEKVTKEAEIAKVKLGSKVDEINITLKKTAVMQNKVMQKTTTYYMGKAMGVVND